jgi:hypothetical protein
MKTAIQIAEMTSELTVINMAAMTISEMDFNSMDEEEIAIMEAGLICISDKYSKMLSDAIDEIDGVEE